MGKENPTDSLENRQEAESAIEHNVHMLETEMEDELGQESIGGNAGTWEINGKRYSCGGVPAYINLSTGKFEAFGFPVKDIKETTWIMLRVACNYKGDAMKIVGVKSGTLPPNINSVVAVSIEKYNQKLRTAGR